jgi:hypothetical protein
MRISRRTLGSVAALAATLGFWVSSVSAAPDHQRSAGMRAVYTGIAVVANVVPGVSAIYAPRCLPGYVVCKVVFAGMSLIAAADQLVVSGAGDLEQTRGILHRGFAGDWYLTADHVSGAATPEPLPDPPTPTGAGGGKWEPPPL